MALFQVRDNSVLAINDALRQIADALTTAVPAGALVLFPDGQEPPRGWAVADDTKNRPDLRAHGIADYVFIVRLG
jgi:hypothetical protein